MAIRMLLGCVLLGVCLGSLFVLIVAGRHGQDGGIAIWVLFGSALAIGIVNPTRIRRGLRRVRR